MKSDGYVIIVDPARPTVEYDTAMCVHCNKHWRIVPGSGHRRGFCTRCMGPTCGAQPCETRCWPLERQVNEALERNRLAAAMGLVTA